jgi:hypothetical protein
MARVLRIEFSLFSTLYKIRKFYFFLKFCSPKIAQTNGDGYGMSSYIWSSFENLFGARTSTAHQNVFLSEEHRLSISEFVEDVERLAFIQRQREIEERDRKNSRLSFILALNYLRCHGKFPS